MIAVGTRLGHYTIISTLGVGGMGEVYRARDQRLDREVAIKVLPERLAENTEMLGRFQREARALAALSHPHILTIYDFGNEQGIYFAVTELLNGETLRSRIVRAILSWQQALQIATAIAEGICAAHSKGVIHRDLKPENIFLTIDGIVKILDFGLARIESAEQTQNCTSLPTKQFQTDPSIVMGTVPYMSPELVAGEPVDARTDIFSFGCVFYEMLTGNSPFQRSTPVKTMAAILKEHPLRLSKISKKTPTDLERLILHCLEKDQQQRFPSAQELLVALKTAANNNLETTFVSDRHQTRRRVAPRQTRKTIDSLAILPLANTSLDLNAEYLIDGITESIINSLSQFPKLKVMARSTVFRYKNQPVDPQQIGQQLNVRALVTGRAVQLGDTLNIQVELVDVFDGSQLWGEQYQRKLTDIFVLQEEISRNISKKLLTKLSGEEQRHLAKRYTNNTEAYQLYLKGRYHWNKRTSDSLKKSIEYFNLAIEKDPCYALAYAGLADSYVLLANYGGMPPKESIPKAKAAAQQALSIDETLAQAHCSLAHAIAFYDRDWTRAELGYQRAIQLNPNYATAHSWYGHYLIAMGRLDAAIARTEKAQELDPLSLILSVGVGWAYFLARRYDQAIQQFSKTIEMDANFVPAHYWLGWTYIFKGMYQEALVTLHKALQLDNDPDTRAALGYAYAAAGDRQAAQEILTELMLPSSQRYISPLDIAALHTALGAYDEAFEWLEKAYKDQSEGLIWLNVTPKFDHLRTDPRFFTLAEKIGLTGMLKSQA
ncbi:MAG: protein kinase [Acidobacteriota bacterium]